MGEALVAEAIVVDRVAGWPLESMAIRLAAVGGVVLSGEGNPTNTVLGPSKMLALTYW